MAFRVGALDVGGGDGAIETAYFTHLRSSNAIGVR